MYDMEARMTETAGQELDKHTRAKSAILGQVFRGFDGSLDFEV